METLKQIEEQIKALSFPYIQFLDNTYIPNEVKKDLKHLLIKRACILNKRFLKTSEEVKSIKELDKNLTDKRKAMYKRVSELDSLMKASTDPEFDTYVEIVGKMQIIMNFWSDIEEKNWEGELNEIKHFKEDSYYGSDFHYMIYLQSLLYPNIAECYKNVISDEYWNWEKEFNLLEMNMFKLYPIDFGEETSYHFGWTAHNLENHQGYSLPDLARINDVWTDVHVICQNN